MNNPGVAHDQSRSGVAFRKVRQPRQTGQVRNYMHMRSALLDDPETMEWAKAKGLASNERELSGYGRTRGPLRDRLKIPLLT